jgi:hypothetical protein
MDRAVRALGDQHRRALTLRWDQHPKDASFTSLHHPVAILPNAHDPLD